MTTQAHIFYSGMVQGVGFRYTVEQFASALNLTGWVKNLADGRVELVAEGSPEDIEKLTNQADGRFAGYIKEKRVSFSSVQGTFKNFQIIL